MIPESYLFDQSTIRNIIESDEVVQGYRVLFSLFDWSVLSDYDTLSTTLFLINVSGRTCFSTTRT